MVVVSGSSVTKTDFHAFGNCNSNSLKNSLNLPLISTDRNSPTTAILAPCPETLDAYHLPSMEDFMSISSVSSASSLYQQTTQTSPLKQAQTDFAALSQALAAGNLNGAQQAYAAFQQDMQGIQSSQGTVQSPAAAGSTQNSIQGDLSAVGSALKSGNLTAAQNAFANLQQGLQSAQQGQASHGHHHHHHGGGAQSALTALTSSSAGTTASGNTSSIINTTA
jgi:hypothetical protein